MQAKVNDTIFVCAKIEWYIKVYFSSFLCVDLFGGLGQEKFALLSITQIKMIKCMY